MVFIDLNDITEKEIIPGFKGKFIHSENVTLVHWQIKAGSQLKEHNHHHEQITNVINGILELKIENKTKQLKSGELAIVPPNIKHEARAITNCFIIDVFYPIREDYKIELSG